MKTIVVTPNYGAMFDRFITEFERECSSNMLLKNQAKAIRGVLAPFAVCLNAAGSAEDIERLRAAMEKGLNDLQKKAGV